MPDTVTGSIATTETLVPGNGAAVTIDTAGDHDWYKVEMVAGTTYVISTWAIPGENPDTFLALRDSAGTSVATDDDGGDGTYSTIRYTATASGSFYIDAGTFNNETTGSFRLTVAEVPPAAADIVGADTATTGTLALGGVVAGRIETGSDHDWYAVTLTAGESYVFRTGPTTSAGNFDTVLTIRDSAGTIVGQNDDAGELSFSAVRVTPTTTGTYYVDVSAYSGSSAGNFVVTGYSIPPLELYTNDQIANQLTNGYWGGSSRHFNVATGGTVTYNVTALTADGANLANQAFALWSDVTGINFTAVSTGGQIVLDDNQTGAFANSTVSGGLITGSTVNVGTAWLSTYGTGLNSYSFQTYIHEIGHAIGLGHAGNYNGSASYGSDALYLNDAWATTIMSYFDQTENTYFSGQGFTREFVLTPMMADGVATTALYGTATTTRTGDTVYGFNNTSGRAIYDATANPTVGYTVYDNGGTDTLDYSGFSQVQSINLNAETFSSVGGRVGNVSIARGVVIENAIGGSGNDTLTGNGVSNILDGQGGNDHMLGGAGDDTYIVNAAGDVVTEDLNAGIDRVFAMVTWTLGDNVEDLTLIGTDLIDGTGNALDNRIRGNTSDNTLTGGEGNDRLIGELGDDEMLGGAGDDTYLVDAVGDVVTEALNAGVDRVVSTVTWTLGDNVESLALTGTDQIDGTGNALNNAIIGNTNSNTLAGGEGNDNLNGGLGDDEMSGGAGNDIYVVDAAGDVVTEDLNAGVDRVFSAVTWALGDNVENLILTGTALINGTGNALNNAIMGNANDNVLTGGQGNDNLTGGAGADTFVFSHFGAANGIDRLIDFQSTVDHLQFNAADFGFAFGHVLTSAEFSTGAAIGTSGQFVYDTLTRALLWDANGALAGGATRIAIFSNGAAPVVGDFTFI